MRFIIADTFMRSLARLEREEQGLVKQVAFEFQAQPDSPGFSFHKLERARDARFWSFRANRDLRIIVQSSTRSPSCSSHAAAMIMGRSDAPLARPIPTKRLRCGHA